MDNSNNSLRSLLFSKGSDSNPKESSSYAPSSAASPLLKSSQPLKVPHISQNTLHSLRQSLSTYSTKTQAASLNPQPSLKQKRSSGKTSVRSTPGNSHFQLLESNQSPLNESSLIQPPHQESKTQPLNHVSSLTQSPLRFQLSQAPLYGPRSSPKRQHLPSSNFRTGQSDSRQQKQTLLAKVSKSSSPWGYQFPPTPSSQGSQGGSFSKFMGGQPASPQLERFSTSPDTSPIQTPMLAECYSSSAINARYSVAPSANNDEGFSSISKPLVMNPNSLFDANDSNDSGSDEPGAIGDAITMPLSSNEASLKFVKSQLKNKTFKERLLKRHGHDSKNTQGLPQMLHGRKTGMFSLGGGNNTAKRSFGLKSPEIGNSSDPLMSPAPTKFSNKTKSHKTQVGQKSSSSGFSSQSQSHQDSSSSETNDANNDTGYDTGYTSSYTSSMDSKHSNNSIPPNPAGLFNWTDRLMRERETAPAVAFPDQDNLLNVGFLPISQPSLSAMCSKPVLPVTSKKHRSYSVLRPLSRGYAATNMAAAPSAPAGFELGSLTTKPASNPDLGRHKIMQCISEVHKSGKPPSQPRRDTSEVVKNFRFKRTEDALHKSGMWDVAMKTGNLIRKNQELKQELDTFKGDALTFLKSVMKNPQNKDFIRTLLINVLKSGPGGRKHALMATIMGLAKKQGIVQPVAQTERGVSRTGNDASGTGNDVSGAGLSGTNIAGTGTSERGVPNLLQHKEVGLDLSSASMKNCQPGLHVHSNFYSQRTQSDRIPESYTTVTAGLPGVDMRCTAVVKEEPADPAPLNPWLPASPFYHGKPGLPLAASSTPS